MDDDSIKINSGAGDNTDGAGGADNTTSDDEQGFSSAEKVFDITSDLNITPVNDLTAAEEAKEKDTPIENFAEKIAAETKGARIYRESDAIKKKSANPEPTKTEPAKSQKTQSTQAQPTQTPRPASPPPPTYSAPAPSPTQIPVPKKEDVMTTTPLAADKPRKKYDVPDVVQTKPWVKNGPLQQGEASHKVDNVPQKPISDVIPNLENNNVGTSIPAPIKPAKIPPQNMDGTIKKANIGGINSFIGDRSSPAQSTGPTISEMAGLDKAPVPVAEQVADPKWKESLKPMRTYEGDVAELLSKKKTSTTTIAIAESKRSGGGESVSNNTLEEPSHAGKKVVMLVLSLILIGAGITGAYYLYMRSPLAPVTPVTQITKIKSIVPNDTQVVIAIDNLGPLEIQYKIQNEVAKDQELDTIKEIILTKTKNNTKTRVTGQEIIGDIDISTPDVLKRSLDNAWMLGVYADQNGNKDVFVVMTNNFFQNAFSGMLEWESVMADDIKQYLLPVSPRGIANIPDINVGIPNTVNPLDNLDSILPRTGDTSATTSTTTATSAQASTTLSQINAASTTTATSTATSTTGESAIKPYFTIRGNFEDRIVRNRDVRAFRTVEGNILFLYSFIDNQRLVITTKEATLSDILLRVEKESFVR